MKRAAARSRRWARASLLAGCGGESHQDLRAWMAEQGKGARGKLDPLPQIKPYEPFAYNAFDLPDPFKPRKIEPTKGASKLAPDLTRRKEPLEAYPLESLTMVGTLEQEQDDVRAGAHAGPATSTRCRAGNYLGQNFGVITGIGESEIKLEGARAGRRRRLDRALEHAAVAAGRHEDNRGEKNERVYRHANYP